MTESPTKDKSLESCGSGNAGTYRPLAEIVAELDAVEDEAREADRALRDILEKLGVGA